MAEIRALGHSPRRQPGLGDEYSLASRLHNAKSSSRLSESQLAELAELPASNWREVRTAGFMVTLMDEIRALGHMPRGNSGLAQRLRKAKNQRLLNERQLAELAEIVSTSDEPVRKRLRVLNA